jgi:hypothetical protein
VPLAAGLPPTLLVVLPRTTYGALPSAESSLLASLLGSLSLCPLDALSLEREVSQSVTKAGISSAPPAPAPESQTNAIPIMLRWIGIPSKENCSVGSASVRVINGMREISRNDIPTHTS